MVTFWRARTAIIPHRPASRLVRHGPYRFTRNPMYVGLTGLYTGLALIFNVGWPLVLLPLVLVVLWGVVIQREERYLRAAFGKSTPRFSVRCGAGCERLRAQGSRAEGSRLREKGRQFGARVAPRRPARSTPSATMAK